MRASSSCWFSAGLAMALLGTSHAQDTRPAAGTIDVYDGFETSSLSKAWETIRFADGAVRLQGRVVRAGSGAAEVTVRWHDKFEAGTRGNKGNERAELLEARAFVSKESATYEYSFSMFFPEAFPIVPTRLVIAQWKQYCPDGRPCSDASPVLALRYVSGLLRITQTIEKKKRVLYEGKGEFRGRWLDFRFQVRFSPVADGQIRAWLGDRSLVHFNGITANAQNDRTGYQRPGYFYFKMGPMTIYLDEYRKKQLPADEL
jgi:hypothetical protein